MKHANSILEPSEYFCQISSKSIYIISNYAVSKLGRFFETQYIFKTQRQSVSIVAFLTTKHASKAVKHLNLAFLSQVFKVWIKKMLLH